MRAIRLLRISFRRNFWSVALVVGLSTLTWGVVANPVYVTGDLYQITLHQTDPLPEHQWFGSFTLGDDFGGGLFGMTNIKIFLGLCAVATDCTYIRDLTHDIVFDTATNTWGNGVTSLGFVAETGGGVTLALAGTGEWHWRVGNDEASGTWFAARRVPEPATLTLLGLGLAGLGFSRRRKSN